MAVFRRFLRVLKVAFLTFVLCVSSAFGYTITYNTNGGTVSGATEVTQNEQYTYVYTGSYQYTLPNPTRSGYIFAGWCDDSDLTQNCDTVNSDNRLARTIVSGNTDDKVFYAKWVDDKFQIETINLDDEDTFSFDISAAGIFYVDWGDGGVELIDRTGDTSKKSYSNTYSSGGVKTIHLGGGATAYNSSYYIAAISFSGNVKIENVYGSLGKVFPTLSTQPSFYYTFGGCTSLVSIPEDLFDGIYGVGINYMFYYTFNGCTSLASIPQDLFDKITGVAQLMFGYTFRGCTSLKTLPESLFGELPDGVVGSMAFVAMFEKCSGLTGYIPVSLFRDINMPSGSMNRIFSDTGLVQNCPYDARRYETIFDSYWEGKVACVPTQQIVCEANKTKKSGTYVCTSCSGEAGCPTVLSLQNCDPGYMSNAQSDECIPTEDYTIRYHDGDAVTEVSYKNNKGLVLSVPTKAGYLFVGWYRDSSFTGDRVVSVALEDVEDMDLYVKWVPLAFSVDTTAIAANQYIAFRLGAQGTFYVDWGDGSETEIITYTGTSQGVYSHTYKEAKDEYTINFGHGDIQTYNTSNYHSGYNSVIAFGIMNGMTNKYNSLNNNGLRVQISESAKRLKKIYGSLSDLFPVLNAGETDNDIPGFEYAFAYCRNLEEIGESLLGGYSITKSYMFYNMFGMCDNLKKLPANMFQQVSAADKDYLFGSMFSSCSSLSGYIPATLFKNMDNSTYGANAMSGMFSYTGLVTSCPTVAKQYETGFEDYWAGQVSCIPFDDIVCPVGEWKAENPDTHIYECKSCSGDAGCPNIADLYWCGDDYMANAESDSCTIPAQSYTVTYHDGDSITQTQYSNTAVQILPTPTKSGYKFVGWFDNSNFVGDPIEFFEAGYIGGDKPLYAQWMAPVFSVNTTAINANQYIVFGFSAHGTLYVDWGDGSDIEIINNPDTTMRYYSHTYKEANSYTIGFASANIVEYGSSASIMFGYTINVTQTTINRVISTNNNGLQVDAEYWRPRIKSMSGSLSDLLPVVGQGVNDSQIPSFQYMFGYCTSLETIDENLFAGYDKAREGMFNRTFVGCTSLTALPNNLFPQLTAADKSSMFYRTFAECAGLSGYIPATLFRNFKSYTGNSMNDLFLNDTNLATVCPVNTKQYETGFEDYFSGHVSCIPTDSIVCPAGEKRGQVDHDNYLLTPVIDACVPCASSDVCTMANLYECPQNHVGNVKSNACVPVDTYTITYNNVSFDGETVVNNNPSAYTNNVDTELTNPIREGYAFAGWYRNADFTGDRVTFVPLGESGPLKLYAKWNAFDFHVTTTEIAAGTTVSFKTGFAGTVYVDWGDRTIEPFTNPNTTTTYTYSHQYQNTDSYTISIANVEIEEYKTGNYVSTISFDVSPMRDYVKEVTGSLSSVFPSLGDAENQNPSFYRAFANCTNLDTIGENLFGGYDKTRPYMFNGTFKGCTGLTRLPRNLFQQISKLDSNYLFYDMFYNCTNLTGYIPGTLFANIQSSGYTWGSGAMNGVFSGDDGLTNDCESIEKKQYETGFENVWNSKQACIPLYSTLCTSGNKMDPDTLECVSCLNEDDCPTTAKIWCYNGGEYDEATYACPDVAVSYTITYNTDGGVLSGDGITEVTANMTYTQENGSTNTVIVPAPTREGYIFNGWCSVNVAECPAANIVTSIATGTNQNVDLYATWTPMLAIHYYNVDGAVNNNPGYFMPGETVALVDPTKDGHVFLGWCRYSDGNWNDGPNCYRYVHNIENYDSDAYVYAAWAENTTLSCSAGEYAFWRVYGNNDVSYSCYDCPIGYYCPNAGEYSLSDAMPILDESVTGGNPDYGAGLFACSGEHEYSSDTGATSCSICDREVYTNEYGANTLCKCSDGYIYNKDTKQCVSYNQISCPVRYGEGRFASFVDYDSVDDKYLSFECEVCFPGFACDGDKSDYNSMDTIDSNGWGSYVGVGITQCSGEYQYSDWFATSCSTCPDGILPNDAHGACVCGEGEFWYSNNKGTEHSCESLDSATVEPGEYVYFGNTSWATEDCRGGYYCPGGTYTRAEADEYGDAGRFACDENEYSLHDATSCMACPTAESHGTGTLINQTDYPAECGCEDGYTWNLYAGACVPNVICPADVDNYPNGGQFISMAGEAFADVNNDGVIDENDCVTLYWFGKAWDVTRSESQEEFDMYVQYLSKTNYYDSTKDMNTDISMDFVMCKYDSESGKYNKDCSNPIYWCDRSDFGGGMADEEQMFSVSGMASAIVDMTNSNWPNTVFQSNQTLADLFIPENNRCVMSCALGYEYDPTKGMYELNACTPKTYQCDAGEYLKLDTENQTLTVEPCEENNYCTGGTWTITDVNSTTNGAGMFACGTGAVSEAGSSVCTCVSGYNNWNSATGSCSPVVCPEGSMSYTNIPQDGSAGLLEMNTSTAKSYGATQDECITVRLYYENGAPLLASGMESTDINDWLAAGSSTALCRYNSATGNYDGACSKKYSMCEDDSIVDLMTLVNTSGSVAVAASVFDIDTPEEFDALLTENAADLASETAIDRCCPEGFACCSAGDYIDFDAIGTDDQCAICPAGSYCPGVHWDPETEFDSGERKCLAGTYSSAEGATSATTCQSCPKNYTTLVDGATVCIEQYAIVYELDKGTNNPNNPLTYTAESEEVVLQAPTRDDYDFAGWCVYDSDTNAGANCAENDREMTVTIPTGSTGGIWLYATWTPKPYTITYNSNGGSLSGKGITQDANNTNLYTQTYTVADIVGIPNSTRSGYIFGGWCPESVNAIDVPCPVDTISEIKFGSGDRTLYATWFEDKFQIITNEIGYNDETGKSDEFCLNISAGGNFIIDWDDDGAITYKSYANANHNDNISVCHTYVDTARGRTIRMGGLATGYGDYFSAIVPDYLGGSHITQLTGSLGAIFPTLEFDIPQVSSVPTASESELGKVYQYIGETTKLYTNGKYYKCIAGKNSEYLWGQVDVGTTIPRFRDAFRNCVNLTTISGDLFGRVVDGEYQGVSGATERMFSATFSNTSITTLPETLFGREVNGRYYGVSGSAPAMFHETFLGYTKEGLEHACKLTSVPANLFGREIGGVYYGVSGAANQLFENTFMNCRYLTQIPAGLFRGISGHAEDMFMQTFAGEIMEDETTHTNVSTCGLTSIPENLFAGVDGVASRQFSYTFNNCTGLTELPDSLFPNITGELKNVFVENEDYIDGSQSAAGMFGSMFAGCTNLGTGDKKYVPYTLFSNISTENFDSGSMKYIFGGTALKTIADTNYECPEGMVKYGGWADTFQTDFDTGSGSPAVVCGSLNQMNITCSAGQYAYLDNDNLRCAKCPAGSYCTGENSTGGTELSYQDNGKHECLGGTYSAAGAESCSTCPTDYPLSAIGTGDIAQCYANCPQTPVCVDNASGCAYVNPNQTTKTFGNTCGTNITSCDGGYTPTGVATWFQTHMNSVIPVKICKLNEDSSCERTIKFTDGTTKPITLVAGQFAMGYDDAPTTHGMGYMSCNSTVGNDSSPATRISNSSFVPSVTGSNCWVKISHVGDMEISSSWVYMASYADNEHCADNCGLVIDTVNPYPYTEDVLTALRMSTAQNQIRICAANAVNIAWGGIAEPDNLGMCTYGKNLTTPDTEPTQENRLFLGWKPVLITNNENNLENNENFTGNGE